MYPSSFSVPNQVVSGHLSGRTHFQNHGIRGWDARNVTVNKIWILVFFSFIGKVADGKRRLSYKLTYDRQ